MLLIIIGQKRIYFLLAYWENERREWDTYGDRTRKGKTSLRRKLFFPYDFYNISSSWIQNSSNLFNVLFSPEL